METRSTNFSELAGDCSLPQMYAVHQLGSQQFVSKPAEILREQLSNLNISGKVRPGQTVAVAVASRGTHDLRVLVETTIDYLLSLGVKPFIIPAMGSHGGGTAEGQAQVLKELGVLQKHPEISIVSSMDVVVLGTVDLDNGKGPEIWFSCDALKADHVVVINRVKPHTVFRSDVESGLCKMLAVGCGKLKGAAAMHQYDLARTIVPAARLIMGKVSLLFGVSVTETALGQTHTIRAVLPEDFINADREQLKIAKKLLPVLPIKKLDLLVVDEMGKNISGPGMDTNVIGFWRRDGGEKIPAYRYLAVLDLTDESLGNGTGIGMADFTTLQVYNKIDWESTYLNSLTAGTPRNGCCPILAESDQKLIAMVLSMLPEAHVPRIARIKNTQNLHTFFVSEPLVKELQASSALEIAEEPECWNFDASGRLL